MGLVASQERVANGMSLDFFSTGDIVYNSRGGRKGAGRGGGVTRTNACLRHKQLIDLESLKRLNGAMYRVSTRVAQATVSQG